MELIRRSLRILVTPLHAMGNSQKVQVVAVVHHRIHALLAGGLEVFAVSFGGVGIASSGSFVVPRSNIDVGRHVNQMPCGRRQYLEPLSAG